MDKIKKSFKKTFLILLAVNIAVMLLNCAKTPIYTYLDEILPKRGEILTIPQYLKTFIDYRSLASYAINLVDYLIKMPFLCGVYSICFARINDEETSAGRLFYFYRSPKRILLSICAVVLTDILYKIPFVLANCTTLVGSDSGSGAALLELLALGIAVLLFSITGITAVVTLYFWSYSYASDPDGKIKSIFLKSLCCSIFSVLIALFRYILNSVYEKAVPENMMTYFEFISNTVIDWICLTIFAAVIGGDLKGITVKIVKKTADKSIEKFAENADTSAYNIGGNYVYTANTPAENDKTDE